MSSRSSVDDTYYQESPPAASPPIKRRKLASIACDRCRQIKVRCLKTNGSGCCNQCKSVNLVCKYEVKQKKRGPRKGRVEELENALASLHTALATLCHRDQSAEGILKDYLSVPEMQALASVEISALDQLETPHFSNQQPLGVIEPLSPFQDSVIDYMSSTNGAPQFSFSDNDLSSPASTTDLDVSTAPTLPLPHPHYSAGLGMKFGLDLTVQAHLHMQQQQHHQHHLQLPHLIPATYLEWGLEKDLANHEWLTSLAMAVPNTR